MSDFFFHPPDFAAAKCGRVTLSCEACADIEAFTENESAFACAPLDVFAEVDGLRITFTYDAAFWEDSDGRGLFEVTCSDLEPWDYEGQVWASKEQIAALEAASGGVPSVLYGAMKWCAKRVASEMKADALAFLAETLEEERAA